MGCVIISLINIHIAETPAKLWAYAGLDVVTTNPRTGLPDGRGRGRYKDHLVKRTYLDKQGVEKEKDSITFEPFLKTKLLGVVADSFIKCRTPKYRDEYDNYKTRIQQRELALAHMTEAQQISTIGKVFVPKSPLHIHHMALRYMIKRFLVDLYKVWRDLEGLPLVPEYSEAKLGMVHHKQGGPNIPLPKEPVSFEDREETPEEF